MFNFTAMRATLVKLAIAATTVLAFSQAQAGPLLGVNPPSNLIVNAGGYEWVYASPCAGINGCGGLQLSNGFNFANDAQWNASFTTRAQLNAAFTGKCASAYFSTNYTHCDFNDIMSGYIWHSPLAGNTNQSNMSWSETFLVRGAAAPVPEPGSLAILGLGLLGFAAARRRKAKA
jgi:hypothetical protein